jgi:hypothetical protein
VTGKKERKKWKKKKKIKIFCGFVGTPGWFTISRHVERSGQGNVLRGQETKVTEVCHKSI